MKVVKWGVHGTGTCIGPGILLRVWGPELSEGAESIFVLSYLSGIMRNGSTVAAS